MAHEEHLRDVPLDDPRDLPRVARHRGRDPIIRAQGLPANDSIRAGVAAIRPAERRSPSSTSATSQKSR
jgi:hypothetical protein